MARPTVQPPLQVLVVKVLIMINIKGGEWMSNNLQYKISSKSIEQFLTYDSIENIPI
jgi:hypothetical protein